MISVTPFFAQASTSRLLDAARGVGDVGVSSPTPAQNSLKPPPVPVLSTIGVLNCPASAELLGDGGRERIHGRRADDADLVAGLRFGGERQKRGGGRGHEQTIHGASRAGDIQPGLLVRDGRAGLLCVVYDRTGDSRLVGGHRRQHDREGAAGAGRALDRQMPLMAAQDVLDDGQAQAGAAQAARAAALDAVEPLGEPRQMLLGDARPLIRDIHLHDGAAGRRPGVGRGGSQRDGADPDRVALATILDRVVDQVDEQLMQLVDVTHDRRQRVRDLDVEPDPILLGRRARPVDRIEQRVARVAPLAWRLVGGELDPRQREEIVDEAAPSAPPPRP